MHQRSVSERQVWIARAMNIYLASGFRHASAFREIANRFEELGHKVVSSWIWLEGRPERGGLMWPEFAKSIALTNLSELRRAALVILDTNGMGTDNHGGADFELGWAVGRGIRAVVIGNPRSTFHGVLERYDNWEDFWKEWKEA